MNIMSGMPEPSNATNRTLDAMRQIVETGNADWRSLPPHAYRSQEIFDLEKEKIFRPGWILIGRPDMVPNPGDYMSVDVIDEPLVMVRDKAGDLRVLSVSAVIAGRPFVTAQETPVHSFALITPGHLTSTAPCVTRLAWRTRQISSLKTWGYSRCATRSGRGLFSSPRR